MVFKAGDKVFTNDKVHIMGILNITPDSFSDGGDYIDSEKAVKRALEMEYEGADIIDIGAQSTRPGHMRISEQEEWERLSDILPRIIKDVKCAISVDTFYPQIAQKAVECGAHIINDVSGFDQEMCAVAACCNCGCIVMYPGADDAKAFFEDRMKYMGSLGIEKSRICFDPGIGFGKDREQDLKLIAATGKVRCQDVFYLIAASRKRVTAMFSDCPPRERLAGTIALHTAAQLGGANIIRAHDVKQSVQAARLIERISSYGKDNNKGT